MIKYVLAAIWAIGGLSMGGWSATQTMFADTAVTSEYASEILKAADVDLEQSVAGVHPGVYTAETPAAITAATPASNGLTNAVESFGDAAREIVIPLRVGNAHQGTATATTFDLVSEQTADN